MSLEALVEISRFYGGNPEYVLAGGGNTSWKDGETLYIKGSGHSLAEASAASFVQMDRKSLALIWEKEYPDISEEDPFGDQREIAVLADLMASRKPGEQGSPPVNKRPSVEVLLHDILPFAFVVHLHPALVNGLTCSQKGEEAMREIFGDEAIWIPIANPGYVLSKIVKSALDEFIAAKGKPSPLIFLQNHGVFVGNNSIEGIKEIYGEIMHKIGAWIKRRPDFSDEKILTSEKWVSAGNSIDEVFWTLERLAGAVAFMRGREIASLVKNRASFAPVMSAFTPDHIVYAGSEPLFIDSDVYILDAWKEHIDRTGRKAKIIAVQDLGIFSAESTGKAAGLAIELFRDAVKVAVYSESFGGPLFMTQDKIDFINNWEVERYRSNVSTK